MPTFAEGFLLYTSGSPRAGPTRPISAVPIEIPTPETLLKTSALQSAILNSTYFSSIATDEKGVIQIFNVGAQRMLGYSAAEILNRISPDEISDALELTARAKLLSLEFETSIAPGFEALVFKAARGIEDIYELTYICGCSCQQLTAVRTAEIIGLGIRHSRFKIPQTVFTKVAVIGYLAMV